jgi:hypothetical protein
LERIAIGRRPEVVGADGAVLIPLFGVEIYIHNDASIWLRLKRTPGAFLGIIGFGDFRIRAGQAREPGVEIRIEDQRAAAGLAHFEIAGLDRFIDEAPANAGELRDIVN